MSISSISTAYLNTALLPSVNQAQSQLATLEVEASTGQYADLGLQLGSQSGYELSLRSQDDLLQTMTTANGVTKTNLNTATNALASLQSSAKSTAASLVGWTTGSNSSSILQSYGQNQLQQLIAVGNTTSGDTYVFGGQNTAVAPLNDFYASPTSSAKSALDSAFQSYFGFSTGSSSQVAGITATQMQDFLSGPFAAEFQGSNWTSNWSTASSVNTSTQISPGQTVETSTNTNTAGFQQLAQGYAMLSEFGGIGLNVNAAQALASSATTVINKGVSSLTDTQSSLGSVQGEITQADDQMSAQMTLLQTSIGNLDSVDVAKVSTELTTLTTQLQSAYQLTSKLYSMNLAQYLPA
jgi:flagellar hook-associated protein 3 FlgL